jgi:hypothetical protein
VAVWVIEVEEPDDARNGHRIAHRDAEAREPGPCRIQVANSNAERPVRRPDFALLELEPGTRDFELKDSWHWLEFRGRTEKSLIPLPSLGQAAILEPDRHLEELRGALLRATEYSNQEEPTARVFWILPSILKSLELHSAGVLFHTGIGLTYR